MEELFVHTFTLFFPLFSLKNNSRTFLFIQGPHLEDNFPVPGQDFLNYLCSNFTVANIPDHKGWHVHCGRTITARYLYIRLWETNNLTLCEVYVYDESNGMYCKNPW